MYRLPFDPMTAEEKKRPFKPSTLLRVLRFLFKYPWRIAFSLGLLLINIGIEMLLPQIIGNAVTSLSQHRSLGVPFDPWLFARLFLALVLVRAGVGFLLGPIRNRLIQLTLADIRAALYDALQRLNFRYHDSAASGELISRSTTDVWRLQDFLFACLLLTVDIVVSLVVTIVLITQISPMLALITVATMVPTIALIGFFAARLQPRWRKVHDLHGQMTTVIQENIAGVRVVKGFAREQAQIEKFAEKKEVFLSSMLQTVNYWASRVPMAQFIFGLATPLVLWLGGAQVISGRLLIGDLTKIIFYLMSISHRMGLVGQFTNIVQNASASSERILEVLEEPPGLTDGCLQPPSTPWSFSFEEVSLEYTAGKPVLQGISFSAAARQRIAIVGATGSGKTSLASLIPRFYDPSVGVIRLNGTDLKQFEISELRRNIGIIFQETFLFSASVAENIAYGKPGAAMADVMAAAKTAQAHEFILNLENGYDTVLGERGISLSGGQRQRIAMARAFLTNPRVLILDDATASVDSETERKIQETMRSLAAGRLTFIIAHRLASVKEADLILVLEEGRLVESGTHSELLKRGGAFARLFAPQLSATHG